MSKSYGNAITFNDVPDEMYGKVMSIEDGVMREWYTLLTDVSEREIDELLVMVAGQAVLVEDSGESVIRPGDVIAWPAGAQNGHRLQNRTESDCVFVVASAGKYDNDSGEYPDIDMVFDPDGYARKDGTRYPAKRLP